MNNTNNWYNMYLKAMNEQRKHLERCFEYMKKEHEDLYESVYKNKYDMFFYDHEYDFVYNIMYDFVQDFEDIFDCVE